MHYYVNNLTHCVRTANRYHGSTDVALAYSTSVQRNYVIISSSQIGTQCLKNIIYGLCLRHTRDKINCATIYSLP